MSHFLRILSRPFFRSLSQTEAAKATHVRREKPPHSKEEEARIERRRAARAHIRSQREQEAEEQSVLTDGERLYNAFAMDIPEIVVGRAWRINELRQKSFNDLHKLWYVLLKEKNRLKTMQLYTTTKKLIMPRYDRLEKVAQAMARIKTVIGERSREFEAGSLLFGFCVL